VTELTRAPAAAALPALTEPLSRKELARFRRGELDPAILTHWMEQTRGLAAPDAPATGALTPNGTGWLVGAGSVTRRIHPRLARWVARSACLAAMGPTWVNLLELPPVFPVVLAMGLALPGALFGAGRLLAHAAMARRLSEAAEITRLAGLPHGTVVRVAGRVAARATVPTLFRGVPAVLFRNQAGGADETRGIDFSLELADGQRVEIAVRQALLLDRPRVTREPPACGPVSADLWDRDDVLRLGSDLLRRPSLWSRVFGRTLRESSIGPGDRVEICGVLHHEAAPDAVSPFDRHVPVGFVLRASPGMPLLVRTQD
jgi:hypothetical protein